MGQDRHRTLPGRIFGTSETKMTKLALIVADKEVQGSPSLGVAYIASYLREYLQLNNIKIFSHIPGELNELNDFSPDIVGISAMSPQFNAAIQLSENIKKDLGIPVIVGGAHISALPKLLPLTCDIGVIGEGEQTLLELISLYSSEGWDKRCLYKIKGIVFRDGTKLIMTDKRERIEPLDRIPYPARDLLDMHHFLQTGNTFGPHFGRGTHMFSSRGCPYNCVFCSSAASWGRPLLHSPKYTVEEIKLLIKTYGVELIHLYDDLFLIDKRRLASISNLVCSEKINTEVKFGILGRVNLFDEEICDYLKKMNVIHVNFGMESGCQRVLDFLKNKTVTVEQTKRAVKLAKEYGFTVDGSFIIGSPDETEEEMMQTLDFIKSLELDKFAHFILTPYPGTDLWEIGKEKGLVSEKMDWDKLWMSRRHIQNLEDQLTINTTMAKQRLMEIWKMFEKERVKLFNYRWQDKFQKSK
jgi:anaerobic magnesium-protoporphyrin IX monomethyl ester cyclase